MDAVVPPEVVANQVGNVLATFAQRRHVNGEHIQPIEEVLTKIIAPDQFA